MFAYCGNCPITNVDKTGTKYCNKVNDEQLSACLFIGGVTLYASSSMFVSTLVKTIDQLLQEAKNEVYDFSRAMQDNLSSLYDDHQPRVHHIVPWGSFSNRETNEIVTEMHGILTEVGIDPRNDPLNLMVVSQGYHKHLHTDQYLINLHNSLEAAQGDRDAVESVLFAQRIIIAFGDSYENGY